MLLGRTFSIVPSVQSVIFPWMGLPSGLQLEHVQSDVGTSVYPWLSYIHDTVRRGDFPFWDQHSFGGGYPFFSNGMSAILYPPRLLTVLLFDPAVAHDVFCVLHTVFAGVFTVALLRQLGIGRGGALLGATAWMYSSYSTTFLQMEMITPVIALLPLDLLLVHRTFQQRSWKWALTAGWALGMTLISGNPADLGLVYLAAAVFAVALAARTLAHPSGRRPDCSALGHVVVIGITSLTGPALVLLPSLITLAASGRRPATYGEIMRSYLIPPTAYAHLFNTPPLPVHLSTLVWVGSAPALLAAVGFAAGRGIPAWLGRAGLVLTVTLAVGGPATWVVFHVVPLFRIVSGYYRLAGLTCFAVALLAAVGLDLVLRVGRRLLGCGLARSAVPFTTALLVSVTAAQTISWGWGVNPRFLPRNQFPQFPPTQAGQLLQRQLNREGSWPGLVLPVTPRTADSAWRGWALYGATSLILGIDSMGGYDSSVNDRVASLVRLVAGENNHSASTPMNRPLEGPAFYSDRVPWSLLPRLGITHVYAPPKSDVLEIWGGFPEPHHLTPIYSGADGRLFGVPGAASGPRLATDVVLVSGWREALAALRAIAETPQAVVVEAGDLAGTRLPNKGARDEPGQITAAARGTNGARISVSLQREAWLVIPISYDPGWSAHINDRSGRLVRADVARMAVPLPPGQSSIVLRYRPQGFHAGLTLTTLTTLATGAAFAERPVRRAMARRASGHVTRRRKAELK